MSTTLSTSSDGVFTLWLNGRLGAHVAIRTLWDDPKNVERRT